jgi:tRNA modification GTPase
MYQLNDTIVAVSSPTSDKRVIIRISGPETIFMLEWIFSPPIPKGKAGLIQGTVAIDAELKVDAKLYLFLAPRSYTGETLAEIHIDTNTSVTEALMGQLLSKGLRMAGPGEFTARSFLNGKIDLAQAEAVNEIIVSSNEFQLAAAEKLLAGRLVETTEKIRASIMDCLSLIEAGLDFSGEDIEFITRNGAIDRLTGVRDELERLLSGSISYESVIDLPAVGITGAPNAGKSSLLNKLLGTERSIVSAQRKTTRDVLTGLLTLRHCRCVLFDCAGLMQQPHNVLDELAQQAAVESLQNSSVVIFCVDISKADFSGDLAICRLMKPAVWVPVAAKSDLLGEDALADRLAELGELFTADFLATSAKTGIGIERLRETIDKKVIETAPGQAPESATLPFSEAIQNGIALTARHKQAVTEAIGSIDESVSELSAGNDEVTAMMLRAAYQAISNIEQQHLDERILEKIFSRFCIGK